MSINNLTDRNDIRKTILTSTWTREQVDALAPDAASLKAARKLLSIKQWPLLEHNGFAVWGHCQGSGKKPYLTRIDMGEPAFKCSCPSRKFPCKHSLALFSLYVEEQGAFTEQDTTPDWVQEWLDSRFARHAKKATKKTGKADPQAQAKRRGLREKKITQGIEQLNLWLQDLVRNGFMDLPSKSYQFWDDIRARMIDAQAPGLASQITQLEHAVSSGDRWVEKLVENIGRLHLLLQAYQRLKALDPELQADILGQMGLPQNKDDVLKSEPVEDHWAVLANIVERHDRLLNQRIWLQSQNTGKMALILNFAHENDRSSLAFGLKSPDVLSGSLYFYTAAVPLRAIANDLQPAASIETLTADGAIKDALQKTHTALLKNPWQLRFPILLKQTRVQVDNGQLFLQDRDNVTLPIVNSFKQQWLLLALSGGHPVTLFGEWRGRELLPLGILNQQGYQTLFPVLQHGTKGL